LKFVLISDLSEEQTLHINKRSKRKRNLKMIKLLLRNKTTKGRKSSYLLKLRIVEALTRKSLKPRNNKSYTKKKRRKRRKISKSRRRENSKRRESSISQSNTLPKKWRSISSKLKKSVHSTILLFLDTSILMMPIRTRKIRIMQQTMNKTNKKSPNQLLTRRMTPR